MAELAQILHDLVRVETVLWNAVDARLREELALTLARFETMQVLGRRGPCRVRDIADELAIGWSGASKIVDRVESAGHCRRSQNPQDARSSLVTLTSEGRTLLIEASACVESELEVRLAASLPPAALEQLGLVLARLRSEDQPPGAISSPSK